MEALVFYNRAVWRLSSKVHEKWKKELENAHFVFSTRTAVRSQDWQRVEKLIDELFEGELARYRTEETQPFSLNGCVYFFNYEILRARAEERFQTLLKEQGLEKMGRDSFEDESRKFLLRIQAEKEVGLR